MAKIDISELQSVNQVEELSNEDLVFVVGGVAPADPADPAALPTPPAPPVGLVSGIVGGLPVVGPTANGLVGRIRSVILSIPLPA
jgi:hypothetical protein